MSDAGGAPRLLHRLWPRHGAWIVFLLASGVYGFRLGALGLIARDEPRYAAVAKAMLFSGDYVTPRFNGMVYLEKPPLFHWMNAASFGLFGLTEFAMRLPTMLCAAAATALVFAMGRRVFGEREGLLAAVVLGSSLVWFGMARCARFDMPLSLTVTATVWWMWLGSEEGRAGRHYYVYAAVAAALGILLKGPVGLLIPGAAFVLYLAVVRRLRALQEVPWLPVLAVLALLSVPWFVACERVNPGATEFFLGGRNVWRITRQVDAPHQQPWWHTLLFLVGGVLPWSVCLPGATWQAVREARGEDSPARRFTILLLLWVVVTVAVYIPPPVKFFQYVMPAVPALALLMARHLAAKEGRWSALATGGFAAAFGLALALFARPLLSRIGVPASPLIPVWTALALIACLVAAFSTRTGRVGPAVGAIALAVVASLHIADYAVRDAYPHIITDKPVLQALLRHARPGETLVCYDYTPPAAVFYYPGRIITVGERMVPEYLFPGNEGRTEGVFYPADQAAVVLARPPAMIGLVRSKQWDELQAAAPNRSRLLERREPYVIFRTEPGE